MNVSVRCPVCASEAVRRSQRKEWEVWVGYALTFLPYRCLSCNHRFRVYDQEEWRKLRRRLAWSALVLVLLIGLFAGVRLLRAPSSAAPSPLLPPRPLVSDRPAPRPLPPQENQQPPRPEPTPAATTPSIHLGASPLFRANWSADPQGLLITRLSPGPLQAAGLRVGDRIVRLDGQALRNEAPLLRARDEIFAGKRPQALLHVRRDGQELVFLLRK